MNRHPFCWQNLVFGLLFLAIAGSWAVRKTDLLTTRELSLTAAAVLILLGLIGVAATLRPRRPSNAPSQTEPEGEAHEEAHPQP
ncbi:hypothetical protein [Aeromicrobium wangtongii]|uniref:Uncharacterized protein n=1 Tax=Aeromicrobium wangtongii TaxID=2969247 RepID=A0ABY5M7Z0_9ACTN|nr:hypothetical protein [Aeromicrobium wangtongii]MCD9198870.1 hypothetical protein [Aeromicrobium wangtongii]UUP13090.1 hypothetical protein NQV15_14690 [Aeromicrobium wangtongii]